MTDHGMASNDGCCIRTLRGGVLTLTLNRPERANALDWSMGEALEAAVEWALTLDELRAVVLRGAGPHFSAGGDFAFIEENTQLPSDVVEYRMRRFYAMYLSVLRLPVPTLAIVHGSAIGAGLCLALCCDVRLGSHGARMGVNFARIGLHPGMGATALVPHVAGARASDLLLTGRTLDAREAERVGLLSRCAAESEIEAAAEETLSQLSRGAPAALRQTVETLRAPLRDRLESALEREASCQRDNFAGAEVREAVARFRERRAARSR
jgi:enoyl-CoA hydratase